jgi:hypothetical protein
VYIAIAWRSAPRRSQLERVMLSLIMADMGGGVVGTRMGSFVPSATGRGGKRGVKPGMLRRK